MPRGGTRAAAAAAAALSAQGEEPVLPQQQAPEREMLAAVQTWQAVSAEGPALTARQRAAALYSPGAASSGDPRAHV